MVPAAPDLPPTGFMASGQREPLFASWFQRKYLLDFHGHPMSLPDGLGDVTTDRPGSGSWGNP